MRDQRVYHIIIIDDQDIFDCRTPAIRESKKFDVDRFGRKGQTAGFMILPVEKMPTPYSKWLISLEDHKR